MTRKLFGAALLVLFSVQAASAEPTRASARFSSSAKQAALLELFTSEGCSSCPPADRWLSTLKTDSRLWRNVVPVAFHVDYWDYIGWRDRFASGKFSDRQRRYAHEGGVGTVYTPGVMQNGREWRGWYRNQPLDSGAPDAGILTLEVAASRVAVAYRSVGEANAAMTVNVALLGMGIESDVSAGENNGRTLQHDFVVLGLESAALAVHGQRYSAELALPLASEPAPRYAIAAWVSAAGRQAPIQSVGGFLGYPPTD
jgi:hypothetical protein